MMSTFPNDLISTTECTNPSSLLFLPGEGGVTRRRRSADPSVSRAARRYSLAGARADCDWRRVAPDDRLRGRQGRPLRSELDVSRSRRKI